MFRYLPGILLAQLVTAALFWVNQTASLENLLLRAAVPSLLFSAVIALWLSMIARVDTERRNSQLLEKHASEREKLNREIERSRADVMEKASADRAKIIQKAHTEREKLVNKNHKQLMQRERSASRRANVKVGLAFVAVTALGVLMLITELLTLGMMTITTAGGAMGGYLLRWRQTRQLASRVDPIAVSQKGEPVAVLLDSPAEGTRGSKNSSGEPTRKINPRRS